MRIDFILVPVNQLWNLGFLYSNGNFIKPCSVKKIWFKCFEKKLQHLRVNYLEKFDFHEDNLLLVRKVNSKFK